MKRQNQTLNAMVDKPTAEKEALATENILLNTKINTLTTEKMAWDAERKQLLAELAEYNAKNNKE